MIECIGCGATLSRHLFGTTSRGGYNRRCRNCQADVRRVAKHGLRLDEKVSIADLQGGCAICGRPEPGGKGWVVDHDRSCCPGDASCEECRRGVLCQWCNNALGYAFDNPETLRRAADYIELGTRLSEPVKRAGGASQSPGSYVRDVRTDGLRTHSPLAIKVADLNARRGDADSQVLG